MAKENNTINAVLGILNFGPASGYDIKKRIESGIGYFWNESYGQIYPILRRLYEDGCVESQTQSNEGKPDSKIYSLTQKGQNMLEEWLESSLEYMHIERNELLLRLFFSPQTQPQSNIANIRNYRNRLIQVLKELDETEQRIQAAALDEATKLYWLLTVEYGQTAYRAFVNWCDHALNKLEAIQNS